MIYINRLLSPILDFQKLKLSYIVLEDQVKFYLFRTTQLIHFSSALLILLVKFLRQLFQRNY